MASWERHGWLWKPHPGEQQESTGKGTSSFTPYFSMKIVTHYEQIVQVCIHL